MRSNRKKDVYELWYLLYKQRDNTMWWNDFFVTNVGKTTQNRYCSSKIKEKHFRLFEEKEIYRNYRYSAYVSNMKLSAPDI